MSKIKHLHKKAFLAHHPMNIESVARTIQASQSRPRRSKKIYKDIRAMKFPTKYEKLSESVSASAHTVPGYSGRDERLRDLLRTLKDNYTGKYKIESKFNDEYQNFLSLQNQIEHSKVSNRYDHLVKNLMMENDIAPRHIYTSNENKAEIERQRQDLIARTMKAAYRDIQEGAGKNDNRGFEKAIAEYEKISLSNYQVFDLLNHKTRVLTYTELTKYDDINDVLEPFGCFVLLYLSKKDYGHWCCVIEHPDRIEFFDPYGTYIDDELENISGDFRKRSDQLFPHLTKLLFESGKPIEYNEYKFQKKGTNINTCGRHTAMRVLMKHLLLDDYHDFITKTAKRLKTDPDGLVTLMTLYINAKKKKNQR
jgi:hypothetical protein